MHKFFLYSMWYDERYPLWSGLGQTITLAVPLHSIEPTEQWLKEDSPVRIPEWLDYRNCPYHFEWDTIKRPNGYGRMENIVRYFAIVYHAEDAVLLKMFFALSEPPEDALSGA